MITLFIISINCSFVLLALCDLIVDNVSKFNSSNFPNSFIIFLSCFLFKLIRQLLKNCLTENFFILFLSINPKGLFIKL